MKRDTMIKYAAVAVAALLCLATSRVYGQVSVGLSAMDHSYWTISEGTGWLPDGSEVQVGDFPGLTPAQVSTLAGMTGPTNDEHITQAQANALLAAFQTLNIVSVGYTGDGNLGYANQGMISDTYGGNNANFANDNVYVLVTRSGEEGEPTEVGEIGVFTGSGTDNANWKYPANMAVLGNITPGMDDAMAVVGGKGTTTMDNLFDDNWNEWGAPYNTLELADIIAVPEPSTLVLVGLGVLGMLGIRRRSH